MQRESWGYITGMKSVFVLIVFTYLVGLPQPGQADQTDPKLNLLFSRLQASHSYSEAAPIEQTIWQIWSVRGDPQVDRAMAYGIAAMNVGGYGKAISLFSQIINRTPDYAEAWNKRATVNYLMARYDESVRDIEKTLMLEPRHFGALSGLGLIYVATGNLKAAAKVWRKALNINPFMPGIKDKLADIERDLRGQKI